MAVSRPTHTPVRSIRVPDDVWSAAQSRAEREGTSASAVVVAALREYAGVTPPPPDQP